jgi:hypothetical protein
VIKTRNAQERKDAGLSGTLVLCRRLYLSVPRLLIPIVADTLNWNLARLPIKSGHQKGACYDEIGLCALSKDTVLGSAVNTIWGPI